jgi:molybdate transport system permease protein
MAAAVRAEQSSSPSRPAARRAPSDLPFFFLFGLTGGIYVLSIVAMLVAEATFTTPGVLIQSLRAPEIQYSIKLSLLSCAASTILSLWVAVPIGYLMSRHKFFGKTLVDAILDIPIVLPPLVIGLCLLILFTTAPVADVEVLRASHRDHV